MADRSSSLPFEPTAPNDPALLGDTLELHHALQRLLRVYQFRDRDRICCYDVSVTQCHALEHVVEAGPVTQNEVAAALFLDKSTTSRVVKALERKGYLVRTGDPEDRRAVRLAPTAAGRALVEKIERDILEREARLLADFEPEVRRSMARLIGELASAKASRIDTSGGTCCAVG